ncbi:hypothetical protein [Burkholderia sp. Bp8963]|uniref:hypothetical protein n=1 Tax=Burkholderia sp. Bp8963 TaxID=2184547 RepID=UPI000F5A6330|nr:hypothetical protein [Burkholderia sp. Bp8963]
MIGLPRMWMRRLEPRLNGRAATFIPTCRAKWKCGANRPCADAALIDTLSGQWNGLTKLDAQMAGIEQGGFDFAAFYSHEYCARSAIGDLAPMA